MADLRRNKMKITNKQLKQIIKEELEITLQEMQVGLGLPHQFTDEELIQHASEFLNTVYINPRTRRIFSDPDNEKALGLYKILGNRNRDAGVFNNDPTDADKDAAESKQRELRGLFYKLQNIISREFLDI